MHYALQFRAEKQLCLSLGMFVNVVPARRWTFPYIACWGGGQSGTPL